MSFIEINYDSAWVAEQIARLSGFMWLYEWGMYLFLLLTLGILFWIFFDSITKHKDQQSVVPRILSMIGFFMEIPPFIFRFTGNADGVQMFVRLAAENGVYYPGPINWNVRWLVAGYGPTIAIIALVGVVVSISAMIVYMSAVHRVKPTTMYSNEVAQLGHQVEGLADKVEQISHQNSNNSASSSFSQSSRSGTVIDNRTPIAATVIDHRETGSYVTIRKPGNNGVVTYDLYDESILIGRGYDTPWKIDDAKVSASHARLFYEGGTWSIVDLGSSNGTYLNEQRINNQQPLHDGDRVRVGDTVIEFHSR